MNDFSSYSTSSLVGRLEQPRHLTPGAVTGPQKLVLQGIHYIMLRNVSVEGKVQLREGSDLCTVTQPVGLTMWTPSPWRLRLWESWLE